MSVPVVSHMHEAQVKGEYLHLTAIIPIKTVCMQFINGSVPFDYSLNSGFDTGMTAEQRCFAGKHTCLENACRYRSLRGALFTFSEIQTPRYGKEVLFFCIHEHRLFVASQSARRTKLITAGRLVLFVRTRLIEGRPQTKCLHFK